MCANLIELVVEAVELAGIGEVAAHQVCQLLPLPLPTVPVQSSSLGKACVEHQRGRALSQGRKGQGFSP